MTDFDKTLRETFYDVTHLFDYPKVVEEAIASSAAFEC